MLWLAVENVAVSLVLTLLAVKVAVLTRLLVVSVMLPV
jgi:hypothetical protein